MNLEVIGVGFGRTGTKSTYMALNELGYNCYHMDEVIMNKENKDHLDFWLKVAKGEDGASYDWSEVFENYDATLDNPGCCVWQDLVAANPNAKILLTLHPKGAEGWYKSTMETVYIPENMWQVKFLGLIVPKVRKYFKMSSLLIWKKNHKGTMEDKHLAMARYQEHIDEIEQAIPKEKLLIYSVKEGWEPLCEFLGKDVPKTDFPRVNDKEKLKKGIQLVKVAIYVFIALLLFIPISLAYGLIYIF